MFFQHLFLSIFLFQPTALIEGESRYFCEGINETLGYDLILELKSNSTHMKFYKHEELNLIPEVKSKIVFQIEDYLIAYNKEENGNLAYIFDGEMLISAYMQSIEESNTFYPKLVVGEYKCVKTI